MTSSSVRQRFTESSQVESRRRRVRKGTLSCWECKRRKVRCCFANTTDSTCQNCKRRKTRCISQEFPEVSSKSQERALLPERLARLEAVIEQLVGTATDANLSNDVRGILETNEEFMQTEVTHDAGPSSNRHRFDSTSTELSGQSPDCMKWGTCTSDQPRTGNILPQHPITSEALSREFIARERPSQGNIGRNDGLSVELLKAWPNQHDLDAILNLPGESSKLVHTTNFAPCASSQVHNSIQDSLQPPSPQAHPVHVARRLLFLAIYLQGLPPACMQKLDLMNVRYVSIMSSAANQVGRYVTGNDQILGSIEGIECLVIEAVYYGNVGNLRRAWHSIGRAILLAQVMSLHRNITSQDMKVLDTETLARVNLDYMWFRLIQLNRYFSMMLGLMQSTQNNNFSNQKFLECCSSTDRIQRLDCAAGGYILQRNEAGLYDANTTDMIDQMLRDSAASVPPTWWQIPDLDPARSANILENVNQTMDQMTHYHLLTQLHLPYLTRLSKDEDYTYNKATIVNASREVLTRFTALHAIHSFTSTCHGLSFLAFIACTTLCIAHINARSSIRDGIFNISDDCNTSSFLLASNHHKDLELMTHSLHTLKHIAKSSKNTTTSKTADILFHLLSMEANATLHHSTDCSDQSSPKITRGLGCGGRLSNYGQTLYIYIPYFGTIRFERHSPFKFITMSLPPPTLYKTRSMAPLEYRSSSSVDSKHLHPRVVCPSDDLEQETNGQASRQSKENELYYNDMLDQNNHWSPVSTSSTIQGHASWPTPATKHGDGTYEASTMAKTLYRPFL